MNRKDNTGVTLWIKGLQIRPEIKCFTSSNHEEKLFLSKTLYIPTCIQAKLNYNLCLSTEKFLIPHWISWRLTSEKTVLWDVYITSFIKGVCHGRLCHTLDFFPSSARKGRNVANGLFEDCQAISTSRASLAVKRTQKLCV